MFRSEMPGAQLAGIYSLERLPEAARLVETALWYLDRHPGSVRRAPGAKEVGTGPSAVQGPTGLDHWVVALDPGAGAPA